MEDKKSIRVGVLTVSDRCSQGVTEDKSGPNLKLLVEDESGPSGKVVVTKIVPDECDQIKAVLIEWTDSLKLDLILTTGGTGFAKRDITPEATKAVVERDAIGITVAMLAASLNVTPKAMLGRPCCGIRKQTLIINLPGSKKGAEENFLVVKPVLHHAIGHLREDRAQLEMTHRAMAGEDVSNLSSGHQCGHHHHNESKPAPQGHHDIEKVARRPRKSPYPLINFEDALKMVMDNAHVLPTDTVSLRDGLNCILAEDVCAQYPLPPFNASVKDGYAVIASDGPGPRKVLDTSIAGSIPDQKVIAGHVIRVTTGAPVPVGADAVVQVEDTELLKEADDGNTELEVKILSTPRAGQDIRPIGCDIAKGQTILKKGMCIGPAELGLLASVGAARVKVYRMPTVAVMSTGNELCEPHQTPQAGQVFDSNRTTLLTSLTELGFPVIDIGIAPDSPESLKAMMQEAVSKADVVVTSGGVSMGEKDLLKHCLSVGMKANLHFGRVFLKPGKPTTFATINTEQQNKLFFALPGNPVSAVVCFNLFVLPALKKMMGNPKPQPTKVKAKISSNVMLDPRPEFHRACVTWTDEDPIPLATSTGNQMSSRLLSMCEANALLWLPPKSQTKTHLKAGDLVDAIIIRRL